MAVNDHIFTDSMERALTKHYRAMWAKRLKKERAIFKKGLKHLESLHHREIMNFHFINGTCETLHTFDNESVPYTEIAKTVESLELDNYTSKPNVTINYKLTENYDWDENPEEEAILTITAYRYTFYPLKLVKSLIHKTSIPNLIRDARFKIANQPNGKDAKRYLDIIAKYQ
jgi:hypothetical protein